MLATHKRWHEASNTNILDKHEKYKNMPQTNSNTLVAAAVVVEISSLASGSSSNWIKCSWSCDPRRYLFSSLFRCPTPSPDLPSMRRWGTWRAVKARARCHFTRRSCWEPLVVRTNSLFLSFKHICLRLMPLIKEFLPARFLLRQDSLEGLLGRQLTWSMSGNVPQIVHCFTPLQWYRNRKMRSEMFFFFLLECRMTWSFHQSREGSEWCLWKWARFRCIQELSLTLCSSSSYKHAVDGLYRVFREGKPAWPHQVLALRFYTSCLIADLYPLMQRV